MIDKIINTVIQGDCLDVMKSLPDKCIDLVLTDPPYGIGIKNKVGGNNLAIATDYKSFDDTKIPDKSYFEEIKRISNNAIIFGGNYFVEFLDNSSCWLVWDKDNTGNFADCELAWTNYSGAIRKIKYRWNGMLQENMKNKEERFHPTQKPVALFQWILNNYSQPGMTIFDPFAGSGTAAIACLETGRDYILVEKEPEYIEIINKRIETWKEQGRMFL
jgi:site-specific DNA-methyltransferase (adenine-specific)